MANPFFHVASALFSTIRGQWVGLANPVTGEPLGTSAYPLYTTAEAPSFPTAASLTSAAVTFSSSGDNTVVAAVSAQTTRIFRLLIVVAGATNITIKRGSTSLTGAMPLAANGSIVLDLDSEPWFVTGTNEAFIINSSAAVQVSGLVQYATS